MLFSSISNLNMYAKNIKMTQQWHRKQEQGKKTYLEQVQSAQNPQSGVIGQMKALQEARAKRYTVEGLTMKLQMGKKLSGDEMEFLRENAPELYQKAVRVAAEREEYARKLRNCKTKEDVRRLNLSVTGALSPQGKSGVDSQESIMKINAINDEHSTFVATKAYKDLPDDWKEEKELDRAERIKKKKKRSKSREVLQLERDRHLMPDFMQKAAEKEALKMQGKVPGVAENGKAGDKAEGLGTEAGQTGGEVDAGKAGYAGAVSGQGTGMSAGQDAPMQTANTYYKTGASVKKAVTKGFAAKV